MRALAISELALQTVVFAQRGNVLPVDRFNQPGYECRLGFGVDWDQNNTDDTLPAAITCVEPTDNAAAACTVWDMSSTGVASLPRVRVLSKGKFGAPELVGYYDMPFQVRFWR